MLSRSAIRLDLSDIGYKDDNELTNHSVHSFCFVCIPSTTSISQATHNGSLICFELQKAQKTLPLIRNFAMSLWLFFLTGGRNEGRDYRPN